MGKHRSGLSLGRLLLICIILAIFGSAVAFASGEQLEIHYIDVGQADCILIKAPKDQNILIDGGNNDDGPGIVKYIKAQGVRKFKAVIATHPHEDHIGGLDTVIRSIPVANFYMPNKGHTTKTFRDLLDAVNKSGAKKMVARAGVSLNLDGVKAAFLAPWGSDYEEINDYSAVLSLKYGERTFLFTGDAEKVSESEMLAHKSVLKADVLKVGHHGSYSSTSPGFLRAVSPQIAVISCGKDNDYGHPHKETLEKLASRKIQVYRTDINGTVVVSSDGKSIKVRSEKAAAETTVKPGAPPDGTKITVYITNTGKQYHAKGCTHLARSEIPISLGDAKAKGYLPCKTCKPPE